MNISNFRADSSPRRKSGMPCTHLLCLPKHHHSWWPLWAVSNLLILNITHKCDQVFKYSLNGFFHNRLFLSTMFSKFSCFSMYKYFTFFKQTNNNHYMDIPHFIYSLITWRTLGLFPLYGTPGNTHMHLCVEDYSHLGPDNFCCRASYVLFGVYQCLWSLPMNCQ